MSINKPLKSLILFCVVFCYCVLKAQPNNGIELSSQSSGLLRARNKRDADKPGCYELVCRVSKTTLNKGDSTVIDVFFTGYGKIGNSKLYIVTSDSIFSDESTFHTDANYDSCCGFLWGYRIKPFGHDDMLMAILGGIPISDTSWNYKSFFVDFDSTETASNGLLTERYTGVESPFQFHLKSRNNVSPGDYNIQFVFTYYNGVEWKSSKQTIPIHINSPFQKYQDWLVFIGVLFTIFAVIIPLISNALKLYKRLFRNKEKELIINDSNNTNTPEPILSNTKKLHDLEDNKVVENAVKLPNKAREIKKLPVNTSRKPRQNNKLKKR